MGGDGELYNRLGSSKMHFCVFLSWKDAIQLLDPEDLTSVLWKIMCREFPPLYLLVPCVV